ncbi:MAG: hypothetical protein KGJ07_07960, partial [Patescibacteria group bacterium]|nr:hypothetical protein [Patescibacteria group bacterium]
LLVLIDMFHKYGSRGASSSGQQQGNNDPIMQALGCTSQQSCNELCQKPENQAKCQQVFQQYGQQNRTGNYNPNAPQGEPNVDFAMAGNNGNTTTANLPDCTSNTLFDHLPTDTNAYTGIEALGHMNGQHVLPDQADHVYINMIPGVGSPSQLTTVYSPGNVTLLQVVKKSNYIGENQSTTDYLLEFSPCKSVIFTYDHIQNLNSDIMHAISGQSSSCQQGGVHANCTYPNLSVKLTSGEKIGTAGGPNSFEVAFDFGGADVRTKELAFIDTSPSAQTGVTASSYLHAVCPLNYFSPSLKSILYNKLTMKNAGVNGIPQCGTTMQDRAGTALGNWYHQGSTQSYQGLNIQGSLAFAHSNLDPTKGEISAGTDLLPSSDLGAQILFTPQNSGFINREPSQITSDGHVYCFDGPEGTGGNGNEGHVDIQLTNASILLIHYGSGACTANPTLTNPLTYIR